MDEVGRVAAFVALSGAETAGMQDRSQRMEALGAGPECLREGGHPDREQHELLEIDSGLRMGAAVQDIELGTGRTCARSPPRWRYSGTPLAFAAAWLQQG